MGVLAWRLIFGVGAKVSFSTNLVSTGIPSLDDILGGGLPLSCSLLIAAPDHHSSYGELVQKYFIAQGLRAGHALCVIANSAEEFVSDVMWIQRNANDLANTPIDDEENLDDQEVQKIKIAWRYEQMRPFQTTVSSTSSSSTDDFCHSFDLSSRVPTSVIENAIHSGRLSFISTASFSGGTTLTSQILSHITTSLLPGGVGTSPTLSPLRICIPSLGSPHWGELTDQHILNFLHSLRSILRRHPYTCASISLAPHLSTHSWGGLGWMQKLGWVSDAALSLSAFSADPALMDTFPNHHGIVHIQTLPAPRMLLPPSDRFSTLRGLSATGGAAGGSENNITFKSTRKRLVFETLHLNIEGGVGERRTTSSSKTAMESISEPYDYGTSKETREAKSALPAVEVALEDLTPEKGRVIEGNGDDKAMGGKQKKPRKQVAFRADRPDWYDF